MQRDRAVHAVVEAKAAEAACLAAKEPASTDQQVACEAAREAKQHAREAEEERATLASAAAAIGTGVSWVPLLGALLCCFLAAED